MASINEKNDLKEFLRKVDELGAVVNGDVTEEKLEETFPVNRTVINRNAFQNESTSNSGSQETAMDQDSFMKSIEADAAERAARRRTKTKVAVKLKEEGNSAFKDGDYETAVEKYTEGLSQIKDMVALYTNRAQAYLRLGKFMEAIGDCDTAVLLDPAFTKAYVNKGRALVELKQYDQAITTYSEITKHNPKQNNIVIEYTRQAEQAREGNAAETKAHKLFLEGDSHANNVVDVLEKLRAEGKPTVYYGGGVTILADMLKDDVSRTLFRTNRGLDMFTENGTISSGIRKVKEGSKGVVELELVMSSIDLLDRSIINNDENLSCLLKHPSLLETILGLLACNSGSVAYKCLILLLKISFRPLGLSTISSNFDVTRFLVTLLTYMQTRDAGISECAKLLHNLRTIEKITQHFTNRLESDVFPAFEKLFHNHSRLSETVVSSSLSFLETMVHDSIVRKKIGQRRVLFDYFCDILAFHSKTVANPNSQSILISLLGLLINVTLDTSLPVDQSESMVLQLLPVLDCEEKEVVTRSLNLYCRLVPRSPTVIITTAIKGDIPEKLIKFIYEDNTDVIRSSIKLMALITQGSTEVRERIVSSAKDLQQICSLLDRDDDLMVANTALCLGHCFEVKQAATILENTDIVKTLLKKTDTTNDTIKQNSAIALAKLSMGNERHLERLRELGGISILHSCMRYVK